MPAMLSSHQIYLRKREQLLMLKSYDYEEAALMHAKASNLTVQEKPMDEAGIRYYAHFIPPTAKKVLEQTYALLEAYTAARHGIAFEGEEVERVSAFTARFQDREEAVRHAMLDKQVAETSLALLKTGKWIADYPRLYPTEEIHDHISNVQNSLEPNFRVVEGR